MNRTISHTVSQRVWISALAVLCVGAGLPSAFAGDTVERIDTISVKVKYADLDLSKPAGAETLLLRIKRAAHSVCGGASDPWDGQAFKHERECFNDAVANAVRQVNNSNLTAMYREHSKGSSYG